MNNVYYASQDAHIDLDAAGELMDSDICEELHLQEWESDQKWFEAYLIAHKAKFDEDFLVSSETGGLCW